MGSGRAKVCESREGDGAMKNALLLAALLLGATHWAVAAESTANAGSGADAQFKAIYTAEWAWRTGKAGENAKPDNSRLDTADAQSQQQRLDYWQNVMHQLDGIDAKRLTPEDQIDYAVYREQIANLLADQQFKQWQMPFNSDSAFWSDIGYELDGDRLRTADDYKKYLDKLGQIPKYFDQQIDNMRAGLQRGFSVPHAVLDGRDRSIKAVAELTDPTQSSFYKPFQQMPASIPSPDQAAMRDRAKKLIRDGVIPAYRKLLRFFDDEYVPRSRTTLAAESLPDGKAYYAQQLKKYTTLDLTPDQIHQIGLDQVAKIHAQMLEVMKQTGFKGDFAAFLRFLRGDPQFYAT